MIFLFFHVKKNEHYCAHDLDHDHDHVQGIIKVHKLINRPGVAGAVLRTPSSFIKSVRDPFPPNLHFTSLVPFLF